MPSQLTGQGVAAHHTGGDGIEGADKALHAALIVAASQEKLEEAAEGHVALLPLPISANLLDRQGDSKCP